MSATATTLPYGVWPAALRRKAAAAYISVSASKFDELRDTGKVPPPKILGGVLVWLRIDLDEALDALPTGLAANDNNPWDEK